MTTAHPSTKETILLRLAQAVGLLGILPGLTLGLFTATILLLNLFTFAPGSTDISALLTVALSAGLSFIALKGVSLTHRKPQLAACLLISSGGAHFLGSILAAATLGSGLPMLVFLAVGVFLCLSGILTLALLLH